MGSFLSTCCYESENELNLNETYEDLQSDLDPVTKGNRIWYTELQDINYNVEAGEFSWNFHNYQMLQSSALSHIYLLMS